MKHFYFSKYLFLLVLGVASLALNGQETYTFTTAGAVGNIGPTQDQINTAYSGTNLDGEVTINVQGIQEWIVPSTGNYRIQAVGSTGGNQNELAVSIGHPANMNGEFMLIKGDVVKILVGQHGFLGSTRPGWGGGGGTFVTSNDNTPLIIAGACGSGHTGATDNGLDTQNASIDTEGKNGTGGSGDWLEGMGATGGNGGDGAGLNGDGTIGNGSLYSPPEGITAHTIPQAFINGGIGDEVGGGFGGGGGVTNTYGGGAGGYSGGQGAISGPYFGGGAGSYNSGTSQDNYLDTNDEFTMADGVVVIESICIRTNITKDPVSLENIEAGADVTFLVLAEGENLQYQWRKDGVKLSNGGNIEGVYLSVLSIKNVSAADEGDYDVVVIGDCLVMVSQSASLTVIDTEDDGTSTSLDELGKEGISVFPNPSSGKFTIQFKDVAKEAVVSIYDLQGKVVYNDKAMDDNFKVDISERPNGIYILRIEFEDKIIDSKIVLK